MDYYEYNVRICLALLYPPQALLSTNGVANKTANIGPWFQLPLLLLGVQRPGPAAPDA